MADHLQTPGHRMRLIRQRQKLKQCEVSKLLGITVRTYQRYENDLSVLSARCVSKFCQTYSVRIEWLLEGEGQPDLSATPEHMRRVMLVFENKLDQIGLDLRPAKRADLFTDLYKQLLNGRPVTDQDVDERIRAALSAHR